MKSKVSISIEKGEQGYSASSPDIQGYVVQGNSLDSVIDTIKQAIQSYWEQPEAETNPTTAESLLELFESITADMNEAEIKNFKRKDRSISTNSFRESPVPNTATNCVD